MRRFAFLTAASIVLLFAHPSLSSTVQLLTLRTADMRLVYYDVYEHMTPYLARCFANSMAFHRDLFDYEPTDAISVLMQDNDDIGFAGATGVPYNWMSLGIEPFEYVYEVSPTNERINWVMSHELLHVIATDQAASSDRFFRKLFFGKVNANPDDPVSLLYSYLTVPRHYAPRWYFEGTATFMETWMSGGVGRAQGGYDEMVWRTKVAEGDEFFRLVGLESEGKTTDFQVGANAYLYGTRFVSYCALQYGPEKIVEWVKRTDGTKRHYSAQFNHVFGKSMGKMWEEWIEWEHGWQQVQLDSVRMYPLTEYRSLTKQPLGSVSRSYFNPGTRKLYSALLYPGHPPHVAEIDIDTGKIRKIADVRMAALFYVTSLAYNEATNELFYTTDNSSGWRDLHRVDAAGGESEELQKNARTGDLAVNRADGSVWGIQHNNAFSTIVRFNPPYEEFQDQIYTVTYPYDLFDIDVSPDGRYFTGTVIDASGDRKLVRHSTDDLLAGSERREILFEFMGKNTAANFVHSRDGKYLFGTSYYSGVSNVYRYDLEKKKMEIITNTDTGFFRPVPVSNDSLIVFKFTSDGFLPVMIGIDPIDSLTMVEQIARLDEAVMQTEEEKEEKTTIRAALFLGNQIPWKYPFVDSWNIGSPDEMDLDSLTLEYGPYREFRSIQLTSIYPIVQSYKTRVAWGLRLDLKERNSLHVFEMDALVTPSSSLPDDEKGHLEAKYTMWGKWEFDGWYNRSDFYDFFGPTKTGRKGVSLGITYLGNLIHERPRSLDYTLNLAGYAGLETLPFYQNVQAVFEEYLSFFGQLDYKHTGGSIGALGAEKGIAWKLNGVVNFINPQDATLNPAIGDTLGTVIRAASRKTYPLAWFEFNYGFRLPWNHSSIWLRPSTGLAFRDAPDEPLNNFYFGGFGNNWIDHRSVKRYRGFYTFPGIELNSLQGTNFAKLMVEWRLPPLRFSSLGTPTFYLNSAELALFTTAIETNFGFSTIEEDPGERTPNRRLLNVGGQLNIRLVSFFSLPYTFSVGYAAAFEEGERYSDEFMISLKIF